MMALGIGLGTVVGWSAATAVRWLNGELIDWWGRSQSQTLVLVDGAVVPVAPPHRNIQQRNRNRKRKRHHRRDQPQPPKHDDDQGQHQSFRDQSTGDEEQERRKQLPQDLAGMDSAATSTNFSPVRDDTHWMQRNSPQIDQQQEQQDKRRLQQMEQRLQQQVQAVSDAVTRNALQQQALLQRLLQQNDQKELDQSMNLLRTQPKINRNGPPATMPIKARADDTTIDHIQTKVFVDLDVPLLVQNLTALRKDLLQTSTADAATSCDHDRPATATEAFLKSTLQQQQPQPNVDPIDNGDDETNTDNSTTPQPPSVSSASTTDHAQSTQVQVAAALPHPNTQRLLEQIEVCLQRLSIVPSISTQMDDPAATSNATDEITARTASNTPSVSQLHAHQELPIDASELLPARAVVALNPPGSPLVTPIGNVNGDYDITTLASNGDDKSNLSKDDDDDLDRTSQIDLYLALETLVRQNIDDNGDTFQDGVALLILYVNNLLSQPHIPRYRKIFMANPSFQKVQRLAGGLDLLRAVGFAMSKHSTAGWSLTSSTTVLAFGTPPARQYLEWLADAKNDDDSNQQQHLLLNIARQASWTVPWKEQVYLRRLQEASKALSYIQSEWLLIKKKKQQQQQHQQQQNEELTDSNGQLSAVHEYDSFVMTALTFAANATGQIPPTLCGIHRHPIVTSHTRIDNFSSFLEPTEDESMVVPNGSVPNSTDPC